MSGANGGQDSSKRAVLNGFESWNAYWTAQGMPWRTEPEIDEDRQRFLAERRTPTTETEKGRRKVVYPLHNVKLNRADVEWLLAAHASGGIRGPVDLNDEAQRERDGLDLGEADLYEVDLRGLPMARLRAAGANLRAAHLEGSSLVEAHLERADLRGAYFDSATLLTDVWFGDQRGDVYARVRGKRGLRRWVGVVSNILSDVATAYFWVLTAIFYTFVLLDLVSPQIRNYSGPAPTRSLDLVIRIVGLVSPVPLAVVMFRLFRSLGRPGVSSVGSIQAMFPWGCVSGPRGDRSAAG